MRTKAVMLFLGAVLATGSMAVNLTEEEKQLLEKAREKIEIKRGSVEAKREERSREDVLNRTVNINVKDVSFPYFLTVLSDYAGIPIILDELQFGSVQQSQPQPQSQPQSGQQGVQPSATAGFISYYSSGKTLRQVLDEVTGMMNLWWKFDDGRVIVYKYQRRMFTLYLPFLVKKINIEPDGGEYSIKYERQFLDSIAKQLSAALSDPLSKVTVDEMGNVIVYARKSEIEFIKDIVDRINQRFTKQIPLKTRVLLVSEDAFLNIGLAGVLKVGGAEARLSATPSSFSVFSLSVLSKNFELNLPATASDRDMIVVEDNTLYALNGQPILYSPLTKKRVVSNVSLTYTPVSAGGSTATTAAVPAVTVNTEDIESGSSMVIVPYFVNDEDIVIDLYRRNQSVDRIENQTVELPGAKNSISLPEVSVKTNINQTVLKKGQTLVLFSSLMTAQEISETGIPFLKDVPVLGNLFKSRTDTQKKYRLVILITYSDG